MLQQRATPTTTPLEVLGVKYEEILYLQENGNVLSKVNEADELSDNIDSR